MNAARNIIIGLTFSSIACAASATSYDMLASLDPSGDAAFFGAKVIGKSGTTFTDTFNFSIEGISQIATNVTVQPLLGGKRTYDINLTNFSILNTANNTSYAGKEVSSKSWVFPNLNLSAGTYSLVVSGITTGNAGGTYSGNFSVSPVPEPAAYAMFMAGIAAIGFVTRRKKTKGTVHTLSAC